MMSNLLITIPAYNAEHTIQRVIKRAAPYVNSLHDIIVGDDESRDKTTEKAEQAGIKVIRHSDNIGYGGNQKSLYTFAHQTKAQIIVMLHGDDQYDPAAIPCMIQKIEERADLVLGSRMATARQDGMPIWKYLANRSLTTLQNYIYNQRLSEYHTGLRAYSRRLIDVLPLENFSDDFVFDSELIAWTIAHGFTVSEVPTRCLYQQEGVSSVNFKTSLRYGIQTLTVLVDYKRGSYEHLS